MREFLVAWEIELTAETPEDAARQAVTIMRCPASLATVFDVIGEDGESVRVDLTAISEGEPA